MSDNIRLSTGELLGADEVTIGGTSVEVTRHKLGFGVDGAYDGDVDDTLPLPVSAAPRTGVVQDGNTQLVVKYASFNLTASGDLVAAVSTKKIRLLSFFASVTTSGTIKFQSGGSTDKTGTMRAADGTPFSMPFNEGGWLETAAGEKLNLVVGTSNPVGGCLSYAEI